MKRVQLFVTLQAIAHQAPLSMGFSRQEYWLSCHALLQGIFLTQGLDLCLLQFLHCRQSLYHWATMEVFFTLHPTAVLLLLPSVIWNDHLLPPPFPPTYQRQWPTFSPDFPCHMKQLITLSSLKLLSVGFTSSPYHHHSPGFLSPSLTVILGICPVLILTFPSPEKRIKVT